MQEAQHPSVPGPEVHNPTAVTGQPAKRLPLPHLCCPHDAAHTHICLCRSRISLWSSLDPLTGPRLPALTRTDDYTYLFCNVHNYSDVGFTHHQLSSRSLFTALVRAAEGTDRQPLCLRCGTETVL